MALIRTVAAFRDLLLRHNRGRHTPEELFELDFRRHRDEVDCYANEDNPYSQVERRDLDVRGRLVDLALAIARRHGRRQVFDIDVLEACLQQHEEVFPIYENVNWTDERLHTHHLTLSHILGSFHPDLGITFEQIRAELGLLPRGPSTSSPVEAAPPEIRPFLLHLLQDYPDYNKNCFLVMAFESTRLHEGIVNTITEVMRAQGFSVIRADHRSYADDLWLNVQTCIYGSRIAIAVFERVVRESFNPNVSYEVGYIHGLGKPVCLLKERTLPKLHTDIAGKLYREFDIKNMETLGDALLAWLKDKRIV